MPFIAPVSDRNTDLPYPLTAPYYQGPGKVVYADASVVIVIGSSELSSNIPVTGSIMTRVRVLDRNTGETLNDFDLVDPITPAVSNIFDRPNTIRDAVALTSNSFVFTILSEHPTLFYPETTTPVEVQNAVFVTDVANGIYTILTPFEPDPDFPESYAYSTSIPLGNGNVLITGNMDRTVVGQIYSSTGVAIGGNFEFLPWNHYTEQPDGSYSQLVWSGFSNESLDDGRSIFTMIQTREEGNINIPATPDQYDQIVGYFLDASGSKTGDQITFSIKTALNFRIVKYDIAELNNGGFVVVWAENDWTSLDSNQNYDSNLRYGIFDANGVLQGNYVDLDTSVGLAGSRPSEIFLDSVVELPDGGIGIFWRGGSEGHAVEDSPVAAMLDSTGALIDSPFPIYDSFTIRDYVFDVDILPDGNLLMYSINSGVAGGYPLSANFEFREFVVAREIPPTTGNDIVAGTDQIDSISLLAGDDMVFGRAGNDTLNGDAGDDYIEGGAGADNLDGGANTSVGDTLSYLSSPTGVTVYLASNTVYGGDADGDTVTGFENVTGSGHVDFLFGDANANTINGNGGADWLYGGADNDTINGGAGADLMFGEAGSDIMNGGADGDYMWGGSESDTMHGDDGIDWLRGEEGEDFLYGDSGDDVLIGGSGDDQMYGGTDTDTFYGEDDNDWIYGEANGDVAFGQLGDDHIYGGSEGDFLFGGAGADTINGGTENDLMWGDMPGTYDGSIDTFEFDAGWGFDAVYDFELGVDQVRFTSIAGLTQFSQLTLIDGGANVTVAYGSDAITFYGVTQAELEANQGDFSFV